jgi:hypothetical protein
VSLRPIDADGLIAESRGHYDQAEYDRQFAPTRAKALRR